MKRQMMAEQWDQFARSVLPVDAPAVQRREMRRAFYAGAHAILFRVITALSPDSEPTEGDLEMMNDLSRELEDFAKSVAEGMA